MFTSSFLAIHILLSLGSYMVQGKPPHIVAVLMDDVGHADISRFGAEYPTPNIDSLAFSGVTLSRFYTTPTCTPTRASFITGRYAFGTGLQDMNTIPAGTHMHIPNNMPTLPEMLKAQGYHTMMFGKWHLGYAADHDTPVGRGFDSFDGYFQGMGDYYTHKFGCSSDGTPAPPSYCAIDFWNGTEVNWGVQGKYSTDVYADAFDQRLQEFIHGPDAGRPLFALLSLQTIHTPISELQLPPTTASACDGISNENRSIYCQKMVYADQKLGEMFQSLETAGLWEDTYVVWLSDNGGMPTWDSPYGAASSFGCNLPLRGGKVTFFEGGIRSFSFISGPLLKKNNPELVNTSFDGLTNVMDMAPTIVAGLAGLQPAERQDGTNLWPAVTRQVAWDRTFMYINAQDFFPGTNDQPDPQGSLIDWPYKFVLGQQPYDGYYPCDQQPPYDVKYLGNEVLLFDLEKDPLEQEELSSEYPELVSQYTQMLLDLFKDPDLYAPMQNSTVDPHSAPLLHNNTWAPFLPFNPDEPATFHEQRSKPVDLDPRLKQMKMQEALQRRQNAWIL